jgi:hypothetical protein
MTARAASGQLARPTAQPLELASSGGTGGDALQRLRDGAQTEHARTALLRALASKIPDDARGLDDTAAIAGKHGHHATPERIALALERSGVEPQTPRIAGGNPATEIPASDSPTTPPAAFTASAMLVPWASSVTPARSTAPLTVTRALPEAAPIPRSRNHASP